MGTEIKRNLPNDEYQAAINANAPTGVNPFATMADVTGGGGGGEYATIYDENVEWTTSVGGGASIDFVSVTNPIHGTKSIETLVGGLPANNYLAFTPPAPYKVPTSGFLTLWIKLKVANSGPGGRIYFGFFNGGILQGSAAYVGVTGPSHIYGYFGGILDYQLVTIPLSVFGTISSTIDEFRIYRGGFPPSTAIEAYIDYIQIVPSLPGHTIQDNGVDMAPRQNLNFEGNAVTLTDDSTSAGNATVVTIDAYSTIENEAVPFTQRSTMNFTGTGVTVTDSGSKTVVTITGGGGGSSAISNLFSYYNFI